MATANSSQSISMPLPIFYGSDYDLWGKKMMTLFKSQNLTDIIVEEGLNKPTNISILEEAQQKELDEVRTQKDASALYLIQQSLAITIFPRISEASTAKQAWDTLKKEFGGDSKVRTIRLQIPRRELENIKMKYSETVKDYHGRVKVAVNQTRSVGENVTDQRIVEKFLVSLTRK
ncbi:hypothetical protein POTOM_040866 [Populus tomentosa]|uniref:DUF4219 domain-containing protein n=1 Tax=Populus tomentosa TaxID=118781 RepID=A0A8X7YSS9_POPTO|nr:hypothetical protein POTOM_040866 [Populus tomentosa]